MYKNIFYLGFLLFPFLFSCSNFPADPEKTLEKSKNGVLKVGIMQHPPFTVKNNQDYEGLEVNMIKAFAKAQNAKVEWIEETEEQLFARLEKYELAMVIGGLTKKSPRKKQSGFTQPYHEINKEKYVIATAPGENALTLALEKFIQSYKTNHLQ